MGAAEQHELALRRAPVAVSVPIEMVWAKRTSGGAFTLACEASGLEDKEIYLALQMDAGTFSRIKAGKNALHGDLLRVFCEAVGNTIYAQWLAYQVDCGLVVLKTEAERRAEVAEARAEEAEKKLAWAMEVIKEIKP